MPVIGTKMHTEKMPNKCDYCGLKQIYPPDTGTLFQDLRNLYDKNIINKTFPRRMYEGDGNNRDEFCLVANPAWKDINKSCNMWQMSHQELSKSDHLSLHAAREANRLNNIMICLTCIVGVFTFIQLLPIIKPYFLLQAQQPKEIMTNQTPIKGDNIVHGHPVKNKNADDQKEKNKTK